jgi:hypothetical protein
MSDADELEALRQETVELRWLFDLQQKRMAAATALWRQESPAERANILPDLGALLGWLLAGIEKARATSYLNLDGTHRYVSTSCIHGDHRYCATQATRPDGTEKIPATCKFGGEPCQCTDPACPHATSGGTA